MTVDQRTIEVQPGGVVVLLRTSRLLAKAAIVLEEDGGRWAVYVATGTPDGSNFWRASVEKTVTAAQRLARGMMDGTAWPSGPVMDAFTCEKCGGEIDRGPAMQHARYEPTTELPPGLEVTPIGPQISSGIGVGPHERDTQELGVPSEEE